MYKYFVNIAQICNLEIEHIAQILCGGSRTNEIVFLQVIFNNGVLGKPS